LHHITSAYHPPQASLLFSA